MVKKPIVFAHCAINNLFNVLISCFYPFESIYNIPKYYCFVKYFIITTLVYTCSTKFILLLHSQLLWDFRLIWTGVKRSPTSMTTKHGLF